MSTIVYQGLQSCLESQLMGQRTVRLKLASPKPNFSQFLGHDINSVLLNSKADEPEEKCDHEPSNPNTDCLANNHVSLNPDLGGWSFLQALSNSSQSPKDAMDKENSYVHPQVKRSLSEKSLELCTENLGSETGTDIIENSLFSISSSNSEGGNSPTREQPRLRQFSILRKESCRSFPPPLTTMSGSGSFQVKPLRQGGRLIINAVMAPARHKYFQSERSNGHLRLCLLKDYTHNFDSMEAAEDNEGEVEDKERDGIDNEENYKEKEEDNDQEEEKEDEFEEEEDDREACLDYGVEMEMEKYQRLSRCKDGGNGNENLLNNWEPCWVATS